VNTAAVTGPGTAPREGRLSETRGPRYTTAVMTLIREARLRPEFAHLYPELVAGHWMPASQIGATILLAQLRSERAPSLGERLLDESHFDFRGGVAREPAGDYRTRVNDQAHQQH